MPGYIPQKEQPIWSGMRANQQNTGCSMHEIQLKKNSSVRRFQTGNAVFSTPIIGNYETILVGSADKKFYAIDPLKNSVRWIFKTNGVVDSAACLDDDGNVYVPSGDACLYKLSPNGQKQWALDLMAQRQPRISTIYWWEGNAAIGPNGLLYAGNDDFYFYAIDGSGNIRWSFPTGLQIWSAPAFYKNLVYITSFDMCVYALNQETGRLHWKRRLKNFIASSPAVDASGNVYLGTFEGKLFSLDGDTGKVNWSMATEKSIYGSPAIAPDGRIFIGSGDGYIYSIDHKTGAVEWKLYAGSPVWSSVVIGQDPEKKESYAGYVGTSHGLIISFTPSGKRRFAYHVGKSKDQRMAGVNASLALGRHGFVACTTAGDIIYIPYDACRRDKNFIGPSGPLPEKSSEVLQDTPPQNFSYDMLQVGVTFQIEKMEFSAPPIINPFDQVGIASFAIDVGIASANPASGRFVAFGVQVVGDYDDDDIARTPYPRRHTYVFNGVKKGNLFTLEAKHCDFDITAFPIPLDSLLFEGALDGPGTKANSFRILLDCRQLPKRIIKKYGWRILRYALKNILGVAKNITMVRPAARIFLALWRIVAGRIWKTWDLLDKNNYLDARGTFFIDHGKKPPADTQFVRAFFDDKHRRVVAMFTSAFLKNQQYPSILLIKKELPEAVAMDYQKHLCVTIYGDTIVATLNIPRHIKALEGIEAVVLLHTSVQSSVPLF